MKTTKEKMLGFGSVDKKMIELKIFPSDRFLERTKEQKNKAFEVLDFEEFECNHPKDQSIVIKLIGVFYKDEWLGAMGFQGEKEIIVQSKEHYDKTKNQILAAKNQ